jgi:lysozyme
MNLENITETLIAEEGFESHCYQDHMGFLTIGIGRMVDLRKGGGISKDEAMILLHHDIGSAIGDLNKALPWWVECTDRQREALVLMVFQLGLPNVLKFSRMLLALEAGDGRAAHNEAIDSKWHEQTPARCNRVAEMMEE